MKAHIYQYTVAWCGHFYISEGTSHFHGTMCNIFFEIHRMSPQSDGCSGQERFFSNHLSIHLKNKNNFCVSVFIKSVAIPICKSRIYNTIYVFMMYIFMLHVLPILVRKHHTYNSYTSFEIIFKQLVYHKIKHYVWSHIISRTTLLFQNTVTFQENKVSFDKGNGLIEINIYMYMFFPVIRVIQK